MSWDRRWFIFVFKITAEPVGKALWNDWKHMCKHSISQMKLLKLKINVRLLGCQPRSVCLRGCLWVKNMLYICTKSLDSKKCCSTFGRHGICMKYHRRWCKICARRLCVNLLKLKINVRLSAEICLPKSLSARNEEHALHFVQNLEIPKSVARNLDRYGICMNYQRRWYKICVCVLCVKLLKLKIIVKLSAEICLPQWLSVGEKHALHFVLNHKIPKSVPRNYDRYGICMKYQRRWYKICACGLCVKLLKLKIKVRLSAKICLPQWLSVWEKHALHFVQNHEIPKSVVRNFDWYGICIKYQRRWYKICARGLCEKLCEIEEKTIDFPFFGTCLWRCFLFWRCVLHFNVIFSLEKVSNVFDIAFLSIAVKDIVSTTLDNSKLFWRTSHPIETAAGESAA